MRVLVVGAGAVGQVYGRHLQLGGADVTFLVRERYREQAKAGFDVYPLNRRDKTLPIRFDGFGVVARPDELGGSGALGSGPFDQVWLTVSSPALRGSWLPELAAATGNATYVVLQPGHDDRAIVVRAGVSREQIVSGMISMISYHAPLPDETRFATPGMAYWFPPGSPSLFSGPAERVDRVVAALRAGKQPAKRHRDASIAAAFGSAVMMPYLVALEANGWSLSSLVRSPLASLASRAAREALAIVGATSTTHVPFGPRIARHTTIVRTGLWLARRVVPLPVESYLEAHFTKVGDQTREIVARYISLGIEAHLTVAALRELLATLSDRDSSSARDSALGG